MTLTSACTPRVVIIGNGTLGPYSIVDASSVAIRLVSTGHLKLTRYTSTTAATGTLLVLNTDYTVGGTQDARTFTLTSAQDVLTSSQRIVAERVQAYTQDLDLTTGGAFNASSLESRYDKLAEFQQELKARVDRAIIASALDTTPSTFPLKVSATSGDLLAFDADKNLTPVTPASIGITSVNLGSGWSTALLLPVPDALSGATITPVATYAAMTALLTATGLQDNGVYYTYGRSAEEDGGAGFWRYDSASTSTANGGTVLAIDGGGAGRFFRLYDKGKIFATWFGLTQGSTSGSVPANNVTAITAAMAQCTTDGGGEVILPPTGTSYISINSVLDNTYSNVLVRGAGRGFNHDVGANVARGGTRLLATAAITMARHRTVSGSASTPREDAGGFVDITFDSGGAATRILHVTSRYDGIYRFYFVNCEGSEAVLFDSLVTGSTLGESADNQNFELDVVGRLIDTAASDACIGVVFNGASNANSSISAKRISIDIIHTNGDAVWFKNADNLLVNMLRSISVGTGRPFLVSGTRASNATYTEALHIDLYSGTNASYVEGTDTGGVTTAGRIVIDRLDDANGTPLPTGGTGALIVRRNSKGNAAGFAFEKLVAGEAQSSVIAGKAAIGASNSLMIYNTSEAHSVLSDGTNVWLFRIQSGNLNFSRSAGSGKLNLPADTNILINTAQLSLGAADSGGAGFKLLRVPN